MEDLGALRPGAASVWARGHIPPCAACRAELEALSQRVAQLKALRALRPPRARWPAVQAVLRAERSRRRRTWGTWTGSRAIAATIAGVLLLRPSAGEKGKLYAELSQAKQQSATLEDSLQRYDIDGRVLSGHAAALVADLEDRISILDGTLAQRKPSAQDAELVKLWQERVEIGRASCRERV